MSDLLLKEANEEAVVLKMYDPLGESSLHAPKGILGELITLLEHINSWMEPIYKYLKGQVNLDEENKMEKLSQKTMIYAIVEGAIYHKMDQGEHTKCIPHKKGINILKEVQEDICRAHESFHTLIREAYHQGFYWPITFCDTKER